MQPIKQTKKGNPEKYGDYAHDICMRSISEGVSVPVVKPGGSQAIMYVVKNTKENLKMLQTFHHHVHGTREEIKRSLSMAMDATPNKFVMGNIGKPTKLGDKVTFNLQSVHMVKGAPTMSMNLMGFTNVECATFSTAQKLRTIMLSNFKNKVSKTEFPEFYHSVEQYLLQDDVTRINWQTLVPTSAKNEFGKYLGELLIGLSVLENARNITGVNPFSGKRIKSFLVPLDDAFPTIDSFFITTDDEYIPISSKAGVGAAASFFTGIFSTIMKNPGVLGRQTSYLKTMYDYAISMGMRTDSSVKSKELVYEIGVRDILKLSKTSVPDTYKVYEEFKKEGHGKYSDNTVALVYKELVKKIKEERDVTAERNIDASTTVFFCKMIARNLSEDVASMDIMKNILGGKNYYQANLNTQKLDKGELSFNILKSGESILELTGTKSPYSDITAANGLINYKLKTR
jgi:hypothetical protein